MNFEVFEKAYKNLNTEQKQAVDTIEGPVMVNAGPGTGKTQILTLRIAQILKQTDVGPENILALTFTNSGAYAMRKRLNTYIGDASYRVNIFTFHAFCEHVIKNFQFFFPSFEYAQVIDDLQKVKYVEEILDAHNFEYLVGSHDEYQKVQNITHAIDTLKKEGYSVEEFKNMIPIWKQEMLSDPSIFYARKYKEFNVGDIKPAEQEKIERKINQALELVEIYSEYQKILTSKKLYDFSDMVLSVIKELKENKNLRLEVQEQYQYLLVDEHQDTNKGQNELIELLTDAEHLDGHPNIFTVGDEKQSIYRFQGASEETFSHFKDIYKDITHIDLKENYRSTQVILDASHGVISHSIEHAVALNSHSVENSKISTGEFSNYKFELLYIAQDIQKKISEGVAPEEIAVLFKSNKHTEDIKTILAFYKIPFSIFSKTSIFEEYDIMHIILLLKVLINLRDEESLGKALFINFIGIQGVDVIKILQARRSYQQDSQKSLFDILNSSQLLDEIGVSNKEPVLKFASCINKAIIDINNYNLVDFLKIFLQEVGYISYMLQSSVSRDKLLLIDKLFDEIKKQQTKGKHTAEDFLKLVDSYHAYHLHIENPNPEIESGVQLMTTHGSKGKEFEHVYIINTVSKSWEKSRNFSKIALPVKEYQGDVHDERRLFYVALTRAKKTVTITSSKTDWQGKEQESSRFIREIDSNLVSVIDTKDFEIKSIPQLSIFIGSQTEHRTIYEPDFISQLFLKRGLSVTALNNYVTCPLKYFYKNLVQIPSSYSSVLQYGNLMHAALEKFFIESKKQGKILPKKNLLSYYQEAILHTEFDSKERSKYQKKGLDSLEHWFDTHKDSYIVDTAVEYSVYRDFELQNGESLKLHGKIDKIEFVDSVSGGAIRVFDYKTGKTFSEKTKEQKEDLTRQIMFYYLLLENHKDGMYRIEQATLDFLEKNKKGKQERYSVPVSSSDIDELKELVQKTAQEIMSAELLQKGCNKKDCEWCHFHQQK